MLTITIGSNFEGLSQASDTICLPLQQAKKVYAAAAQKKVADSLLAIANTQLSELKSQTLLLTEKEQELRNYYNREIANLENQIQLYKSQVIGYEKLLKKERRRRRLATAGGVLTTGAAVFLLLKK